MAIDSPAQPLRVTVETQGGWSVVRMSGELDYTTVEDVREYLRPLLSAHEARVAIELSELDFCDSMGIGCIAGAWKGARRSNGELILLRPNVHVHRMLSVTGVDKVISVRDELPD